MGKLFNVAVQWLQEDDWSFTEYERENGNKWTRSGYTGDNSKFELVLDASEELEILFVYVYFSIKVPEKNRVAVSELINRINYGIRIGNFEFDMNDGEVRYKASIDVEGSELVTQMVRNMVVPCLKTSDKYFPAFMHICYGNRTELEALDELNELSEERQDGEVQATLQ